MLVKKEDIFNTNFVAYEILGKIAICNSNSLKGTIDCYNGRVNPNTFTRTVLVRMSLASSIGLFLTPEKNFFTFKRSEMKRRA